jgi:hypothetical protein
MTIGDLVEDDGKGPFCNLMGIPPKPYKGDRSLTHQFLTKFNRYMMMNRKSEIMCDPLGKCTYFLSLIKGPKVDRWGERAYNWLDDIEADLTELPPGMNAWEVLKHDFLHTFCHRCLCNNDI